MDSNRLTRAGFYLSIIVLSCFYGLNAARLGWFPSNVVYQGMEQLDRLTGPPDFLSPRIYQSQGVQKAHLDQMEPGLTLVASVWEKEGSWVPGLRLLEADGTVRHSWNVDPDALGPVDENDRSLGLADLDIQGSHLFPNGDILVNLEYAVTLRLDACSQLRWRLSGRGHHSITRAPDGTFWIPGVSAQPRRGTADHPEGHPDLKRAVYQEHLRRVSPQGEVLKKINLLDLLYTNDLERQIFKSRASTSEDMVHLNDIEPLSSEMAESYPLFNTGDLLISLRNLDLVMVVDPKTERIKWHSSHPFLRQHDPDFIGDGWIGVFDNNVDGTPRGTILGGSRIVALQPHTSSRKTPFPTSTSDPFYTGVRGKWQLLENGNLLLVESEAGRVIEVAPDGTKVWEWIVPPYNEELVPFVTDATRLEVRDGQLASWPCSTVDSLN